MGSPCWRNL